MDLPYYHGPLTKQACETLLLQDGKDGKFLLRDSESVPGALCLCVLMFYSNSGPRVVHKDLDGASWRPGSGLDLWNTIKPILGEKFQNKIYTYRIRKEKYGYYTIETAKSVRKQLFPNLEELISKFEKPGQGLVVHLRYPVKKNNVYQSWKNPPEALNDSDYVNVNSEDYVEVIP